MMIDMIDNMQPYSEYKKTDVDWLKVIPVNWDIRKLNAFGELNGGGTPHTETEKYWGGSIIWVTPKDLTAAKSEYLSSSARTLTELGLPHTSKILEAGTILFGCRAPVGNVAIAGARLTTNQGFISIAPNEKTETRFLFYLLLSSVKMIQNESSGTTFQEISRSKLASLKFPLPPLETQQRIVDFLDGETARIDNIVSEMEGLITLLQEERRVLISETVTRGIPGEHTEFKDSGVEWLGQIPIGWEVAPLKSGYMPVKRPVEVGQENVTVFRNGRVTLRKNVRADGFTEADLEHGYQSIHIGDLVIHNMDAFAGAIGVSDSFGKSTPVYSASVPLNGNIPQYMALALRTMSQRGWILALSKGIRERSTDFRWKIAATQKMPFPSIEEQLRIIDYLDIETTRINNLITEATKAIKLLKEERKALISDTVTGKVKV